MKNFLLVLLFYSANICLGQTDSIAKQKIVLGINIGIINDGRAELGCYPNFTMEKGQSFFSLGPIIGLKKKIYSNPWDNFYFYSGKYALTGFNAVFQISPSTKKKIFQSYFQNELIFHYYIDNNTTNLVYTNQGVELLPAPIPYKTHQMVIGDYIGWGFKVKLLQNFSVNQSIGMGIEYYSTVQDYGDINYNRNDKYFRPGLILKVGLGYKFDCKLKPVPAFSLKKKKSKISYAAFSPEQLDSISSNSANSSRHPDSIASPKMIFGFNFGIMPSYQWEGFDYYAHFTMEKGKNTFSGGPVIGQKAGINYYSSHYLTGVYALTGLNLVYQRNPNPDHKKFGVDLFFQHEFILRNYKDKGKSYVNDHNIQVAQSYKSRQTDIQAYAGYGIKEKLFKNFYLNQRIGFGVIYRSTVINYENTKYNSNDHNTQLAILLKMGIGYKFDYKSKPYSATSIVQRDSIKQTDSFDPKKSRLRVGINIGTLPSYQWEGLDFFTQFTIDKGKNFLAIGPVIGLKLIMKNLYYDHVSEQYGLTGLYFVYQRNTKLSGDKFDFYFQNEFMFHHYTDKGNYLTWLGSNTPIVRYYESEQTYIEDYIGCGVKIKFLKNFYLDQSFGIGIKYNTAVIEYEDPAFNKSDKLTHPSATLKMALGYTFGNKLK